MAKVSKSTAVCMQNIWKSENDPGTYWFAAALIISKEYASFLKIFDSYPFLIQRADAIRYFVLDHHGGIYLDLDDGFARRLEIMLGYPPGCALGGAPLADSLGSS